MSSARRPGRPRRFVCLSAAWGPPKGRVFAASKATVRLGPSTAHGQAATTDTSAATATSARSPWRAIRMDRSSFISHTMPTMDATRLGALRSWFKMLLSQPYGGASWLQCLGEIAAKGTLPKVCRLKIITGATWVLTHLGTFPCTFDAWQDAEEAKPRPRQAPFRQRACGPPRTPDVARGVGRGLWASSDLHWLHRAW